MQDSLIDGAQPNRSHEERRRRGSLRPPPNRSEQTFVAPKAIKLTLI
jgi:hypothetical protein